MEPPAVRLQPFGLPLTYDRAPWYARYQTARHGRLNPSRRLTFISKLLMVPRHFAPCLGVVVVYQVTTLAAVFGSAVLFFPN